MSSVVITRQRKLLGRTGKTQSAASAVAGRLKALIALAAILCTTLWSGGSQAHFGGAQRLHGTLTTHQVDCPTLCTEGDLTGGLSGLLEFEMASMSETKDPDVVTYVGTNTITRSDGTLAGTDHGIWNLVTGEFVDFTFFSSGTGAYEGVSGAMVIVGTFDIVSGTGSSNYKALIFLD